MAVYQSQIKELYMPRVSKQKIEELTELKEKIKTQVRESRKPEDYLGLVYEQNRNRKQINKSIDNTDIKTPHREEEQALPKGKSLNSVSSHAALPRRKGMLNDLTEEKRAK